jgi:hypothetical membrane protein
MVVNVEEELAAPLLEAAAIAVILRLLPIRAGVNVVVVGVFKENAPGGFRTAPVTRTSTTMRVVLVALKAQRNSVGQATTLLDLIVVLSLLFLLLLSLDSFQGGRYESETCLRDRKWVQPSLL